MISRNDLFAEITNEAICEDGEVVGYFIRKNRMDDLEKMLCSSVTVKLPATRLWAGITECYEKTDVISAIRKSGLEVDL